MQTYQKIEKRNKLQQKNMFESTSTRTHTHTHTHKLNPNWINICTKTVISRHNAHIHDVMIV